MDDNTRGPGRPATGVTPKRQVRIGEEWDQAEALALELARRNDTVRSVRHQATGEPREAGDIAAYIREALRRENARIARQLGVVP